MLRLDHITVAANTLAEGVDHAEQALGLRVPVGGAHPLMGTHNHLLRLGETTFLEVIAPDPAAEALTRPRWFALDDPRTREALSRSPRLVTWVAGTSDIRAMLAMVYHAAGPAITVTRGNLSWLISVPPDGSMPFNGAFPTLIEWPSGPHPASRMADPGCSLIEMVVQHPEAKTIQQSLEKFLDDPRIQFVVAPETAIHAVIRTPHGDRQLN